MQMNQNPEALRDVKCSVDACHFNNCAGKCTAEEIEVSPCAGSGCEGTLCATFIDKEACNSCL